MKRFFVGIFSLILGIYISYSVLPYYLSRQNNINLGDLSGNFDPYQNIGIYMGKPVASALVKDPLMKNVLGTNTSDKRIEVDLTNQRLYAIENGNRVMDFPVSTGKWYPTPTGEFAIWTKLRYTKMSGGSKALNTYYYLPNVPFTMFFANAEIPTWRGFGIHGAYWHNNFGHPMSHGCVNMHPEDAGLVYYWADPVLLDKTSIRATADNPGTKVVIYGETPRE